MSSVLQSIQESVVAALLTVPGVQSAKACAPWESLKFTQNEEGEGVLSPATLPETYPGCVVSLNDNEIAVVSVKPQNGHTLTTYDVPVYITTYAYTDGTADPRFALWEIEEAIDRMMMVFVPNLSAAFATAESPMRPASKEPILADSSTYGMLSRYFARFIISA